MVSGMSIWFVTDWTLAHSSGLTCYEVIEASFSSKLVDEHRKQISWMGGCQVLVAEFGKELMSYAGFLYFGTSQQHNTDTPAEVSLLLSSSSEQFFQDITNPCLLRRGSLWQPPRGVPGTFTLWQGCSQKSVLTLLVWSSCSSVSQSRCLTSGSTGCKMPMSLFLLLPWLASAGGLSNDIFRLHINRESWSIWWLCLKSWRRKY